MTVIEAYQEIFQNYKTVQVFFMFQLWGSDQKLTFYRHWQKKFRNLNKKNKCANLNSSYIIQNYYRRKIKFCYVKVDLGAKL